MHSDSQFKFLTAIMTLINRPITLYLICFNNSNIFMRSILLLCERNFTNLNQE